MRYYALTIFLSAFLLFQVQPLIGKYILPWFGGSPAVWTTCMLLFQILLLLGYGYAHLLSQLRPRLQGVLHAALLTASLWFLPITPDDAWKPIGSESPTWRILALLTGTIGVPYFLLSSTGPLLQSWFSHSYPGRSPYRLYALSNVGSLLALVTYPFLVEPALKLGPQAVCWSAAYSAFVIACSWCGLRLCLAKPAEIAAAADPTSSAQERSAMRERATAHRPAWSLVLFWLALSAAGSVMLLATTNQMCQEVAVVPFLWVLPLALYLLSFVICFDSPRWYHRKAFVLLLAVSSGLASFVLDRGPAIRLDFQLAVYATALFACCMVCHGELVRSKPAPRYLTLFYLVVSAGGALGGLFVALAAPALFTGYWEYHLGLGFCCLLAMTACLRDRESLLGRLSPLAGWGIASSCFCVLVVSLAKQAISQDGGTLEKTRNFYGVLRVERKAGPEQEPRFNLAHGRIVHGFQFEDPNKRDWPTSYFGPGSGIGLALTWHPKRMLADPVEQGLRVGIVGLGAGTIAVYGRPNDYIRFYEINPDVVRMANEYFSFLKDCRARYDVILGDGRIQMEREIHAGHAQQFDVLAMDAFSGDAIPMHLLTRECFRICWLQLRRQGLLVVNISNNHVDVTPVVRGLAEEFGKRVIYIATDEDRAKGTNVSDWLIVTENEEFLHSPAVTKATRPFPANTQPPFVWTDDYGSLKQVLTR
jgi:hypothetical protein